MAKLPPKRPGDRPSRLKDGKDHPAIREGATIRSHLRGKTLERGAKKKQYR